MILFDKIIESEYKFNELFITKESFPSETSNSIAYLLIRVKDLSILLLYLIIPNIIY